MARKGPQSHIPTVKEEAHSSSEEDGPTVNDQSSVGNSQELSSQASSAEPQTPSPQYSAARVHQSTFDSSIDSSTPDPARQASNAEEGLHLANLLSSLQRSAASLTVEDISKPQLVSVESVPMVPPVPQHPAPDVSPDWSARVPARRTVQVNIPQARSSPAMLSPKPFDRVSLQPVPTPAQSVVAPPTAPPSLRPPPASPSHTRRSSTATADISPYLSQPRNITKEMRYISILESVAQESDRAASRMSHRSPMAAPLQAAPLPVPQTIPPRPIGLEQSVIYSSTPGMQQQVPRALPQHTMYQPPVPEGLMMGRPRTSHTFHGAPLGVMGVPRQSMNEHQLRAMLPLNGQWNNGPAPAFPPGHSPYAVHAQPHARPPTSPARALPPYQFPPASHIGQSL